MKWGKLTARIAARALTFQRRIILEEAQPTAVHARMVPDLTRPLAIVHAVVFIISTAWIVLGRARPAQIMALPVKTIQQYWHQIISGSGATKRRWTITRNSL